MKKLTIELWYDQDTESPCDHEYSWKLHSFIERHRDHKDIEEFFSTRNADSREWFPKTIGLHRKLSVGTAFIVSCYQHSGISWFLAGRGNAPDMQWDGTRVAGLLVWDHELSGMGAKTYEDRAKDATAFLEEYTAWANGACYGFTITDEDGEEESCEGFIGDGPLFEELRERVKLYLYLDYVKEDIDIVGDASWLAQYNSVVPETRQQPVS